MANAKMTFYFKDLPGFYLTLSRVEKVPQRAVTKAAGKGATVVRKAVRGAVPEDTGALKRGIIRNGERSRIKGKKVYDLMFDPRMNDVFRKEIPAPGTKHPGARRSEWDYAYYPASMEYGFLTRSKGGGLSYVPGYHFMRDAAQSAEFPARQATIQAFTAELEKEWLK